MRQEKIKSYHSHPALHQKQRGQRVKGGSFPRFSILMTPGALHPALGPLTHEGWGHAGATPVEGMMVIKGLEHPSYEGRVGDVQTGKGRSSGNTLE